MQSGGAGDFRDSADREKHEFLSQRRNLPEADQAVVLGGCFDGAL
jgi:hypothetical protein